MRIFALPYRGDPFKLDRVGEALDQHVILSVQNSKLTVSHVPVENPSMFFVRTYTTFYRNRRALERSSDDVFCTKYFSYSNFEPKRS